MATESTEPPIIRKGANERVRAGTVLRAAARTYRERFGRVAGTAFVVFGFVAAIDAVAVVLVADDHVSRPIGAAVTSLASGVIAMAGVVIYAGILDKVVGAHLHGHPDLTIREITRVLPIRRLIGADVVLAVATVVGLALFVVPGVVIFTLWCLVGPVITIEEQSIRASLRRSSQLVRRHFWLTLFIVTIPLHVEQGILHAIHYAEVFDHPVIPAFLLNGLLGSIIGSIVGLIEVVLAYELIEYTDGRPAFAVHS
jgi:hypothetical protein